ncbi:hypothetical protein ACWEQ0_28610 [Nocardia thailandica]
MPTINVNANPSPAIALLNKVIHKSSGLNPTVSAATPPQPFIRQLHTHLPVADSTKRPNGFYELDLGTLRLMWVVCYDNRGTCAIFFVTHFDPPYGTEVMAKFIDTARAAGTRNGFIVDALDGPRYEAEPAVCRILANGNVYL